MATADDFEALRVELEKIGQSHLFDSFDSASDEDRERLAQQLLKLNSTTPGGLIEYCLRGKKLIQSLISKKAESREYFPPRLGEKLRANTPLFEECEELGIAQTPFTAFVLVAGGLGERLSFVGAKVSLETETLTETSFLENHCEWIAAFQARAQIIMNDPSFTLPFAIMTSDDTHDAILQLLNDECRVQQDQILGGLTDITVLKQEKVPCFSNPKADIALNPDDAFDIVTKPHGHGDLHSLLHKSGLVERWLARGIRWIVVFQDTNILAFRAVSAALGSSARNSMDLSMVAVQRRRGEAVGAICNVKSDIDGVERTLNVEYNLVNENAITDATGGNTSIFPGNINLLVCHAKSYADALKKSGGIVPEFVNPKFADKAKTEFKSPTRLECMMQDLPLILKPDARVGYIEMERFLCFSAAKNNLQDALSKYQETGFPESASSCESDLYSTCRRLLAMSGCQIRTAALPMRRFASLPFEDGARVVLCPSFGTTVAEIRSRFPSPHLVHISDRSALVLDGDIIVHQLELDGHLVIKAQPGSRITIKCLRVLNEGSTLESLDEELIEQRSPNEKVRGYHLRIHENLLISSEHLGEIVVERPF